MAKISVLKEYWKFIKYKKKFWLIPILAILLIIGLLLFLSEGSVLAPLIYTLF